MKNKYSLRDLKTGYMVEFADKTISMVMLSTPNGDCFVGNSKMDDDKCSWKPFPSYREKINPIIKVWGYPQNFNASNFDTNCRNVIWVLENDEQLVEKYKKQLMDELNNPEKYGGIGDLPSDYLAEELLDRGLSIVVDVVHNVNITWVK